MERTISFQCTPDELFELIKNAVRTVTAENKADTQINIPQADGVLSSKEVCELLHISAPTLIRYRKEGKIKGKRVGGKIFYKKSEVEKAITPAHR